MRRQDIPQTEYDHSTKIGNQGDVVKHVALFAAIRQLLQGWPSDRDFVYADAHAGRPTYVLPEKGEWKHGILPFSANPQIIRDRTNRHNGGTTLGCVGEFDETFLGKPVIPGMIYSGSSGIAFHLLNKAKFQYRLKLWEKNSTAAADIESHFQDSQTRVTVVCGNGYEVANDDTPYSLVLIDPPALEADEVIKKMRQLKERKVPFLCWTPRTSRSVKPKAASDSWSAAESGRSIAYIEKASEYGKCLQIQWHCWGHRTPGCCITVSEELAATVLEAVVKVASLMEWRLTVS